MASTAETIDNLECELCQERYRRPKILSCQHSFCEHCLEEYSTRKYRDDSKLPCPTCQRETLLTDAGVSGLQTNHHLVEKVREVLLQEKVAGSVDKKVLCDMCKEGFVARHCCVTCLVYVCKTCERFHRRKSSLTPHKIASLDELRKGKVEIKITEDACGCDIHLGQKQYFCETCDELICKRCHRGSKLGHKDIVNPNLACLKRKQCLRSKSFPDVDKDIRGLEERLGAAEDVKQRLARQITRAVAEVQWQAAAMREEVTAEEERMIQEIKLLGEEGDGTIGEYEAALQRNLQGRRHSLKVAREVTDTASTRNFLSLHNLISQDLQSPSSKPPPRLDLKVSYVRFIPGPTPKIRLGRLEVEHCKWELHCVFGEEGTGPGQFEGACGITATRPGEIAVSDLLTGGVTFVSTAGDERGYIQLNGSTGIAALPTGANRLVVVDHTQYVRVFDNINAEAFKFTTLTEEERVKGVQVDLRSVAVRQDGLIMVGDVKRMVWTEHSPSDGDLLRTVAVQTPPDFLAHDASTDKMVISGLGEHHAHVVDMNGDLQATIRPTIGGKRVQVCSGVSCHKTGVYLAVDEGSDGTGHVHHYNLDGEFMECVVQGLQRPMGITFTAGGLLAVADWNVVKIFHRV